MSARNRTPSKSKVVIIGAGIAGLTAAAKLYHNGVTDVVVLEAQDYVGGRIQAEVVDGKNIDLGAQYIHGERGNPLFTIADAIGILKDKDSREEPTEDIPNLECAEHVHLASNGAVVHDEEVKSFIEYIEETFSSNDPQTLDKDKSVADILNKAYDCYMEERQGELRPGLKELLDAAFNNIDSHINIDNGTRDLREISGWACFTYDELKGERFTEPEGGMTSLVKAIVNLLPLDVIRTESPVASVDWDTECTRDQYGSIVTCESGTQYLADHVIVTVSTGCLKKGQPLFSPPLPVDFTTALNSLELGAIGKVYLKWESPFWNREDLDPSSPAPISFLWLKSFPISVRSDKTKKLTKEGKPWWEGIVGLDLVSTHSDMIVFWFTGSQMEVIEQIDEEEVMAVLQELLQLYFNDTSIPKPLEIYRTSWVTNPYTSGTYTYPTMSIKTSDMETLAIPVPSKEDPLILFAGEGLSLEDIGTAHGAYKSGERNADKVLESIGLPLNECQSVVDIIKERSRLSV